MRLKVIIEQQPQMMRTAIYICSVDPKGRINAVAQPTELTFKTIDQDDYTKRIDPTLQLDPQIADDFLIALNEALGGKYDPAGTETKAVRDHLDDMRTIAFAKLNISKDK